MRVYVDPNLPWPKVAGWRYGSVSHMYADTLPELHALAARIGLKRSWFQPHPLLPHYDLTPSRRIAAVGCGAVEVTHAAMVARMRESRLAIVASKAINAK